jgi:8-oxo-dGTP pyrophosphatase MutT (NUDIX family)
MLPTFPVEAIRRVDRCHLYHQPGLDSVVADRRTSSEKPVQSAAIPFRKGVRTEICLIRRRDSESWGIPKGFIDKGCSPEEAALNEALEEAGLNGRILGGRVGVYEYDKRDASLTVAVCLMRVQEELDRWRDMKLRERRWFSPKEAAVALAGHPVFPLWPRVLERIAAVDD